MKQRINQNQSKQTSRTNMSSNSNRYTITKPLSQFNQAPTTSRPTINHSQTVTVNNMDDSKGTKSQILNCITNKVSSSKSRGAQIQHQANLLRQRQMGRNRVTSTTSTTSTKPMQSVSNHRQPIITEDTTPSKSNDLSMRSRNNNNNSNNANDDDLGDVQMGIDFDNIDNNENNNKNNNIENNDIENNSNENNKEVTPKCFANDTLTEEDKKWLKDRAAWNILRVEHNLELASDKRLNSPWTRHVCVMYCVCDSVIVTLCL